MYISKKLKRLILNIINDCFFEISKETFPDGEIDHAPDELTWLPETKEKFDILSNYDHKLKIKFEALFQKK